MKERIIMNIEKLIKEAHDNAVEKGFYDCPECGGRGEVVNPEADVESELAVNCGSHSLKKEWWMECKTCNGTGIDPSKNIGELLMLIVSELGEALEAHRCGRFAELEAYEESRKKCHGFTALFEGYIKDTFEDEIADVFIRMFDLCGYLELSVDELVLSSHPQITGNIGADLLGMAYELSRNTHHGQEHHIEENISFVFAYLRDFCKYHEIPIEKHIESKMSYNKTRARKHGKEY